MCLVRLDGSNKLQIVCHCLDCRKISGSTYSCNGLFPGESFKVTKGTPKEYKTKGASGNEVVSAFWFVPVTSGLDVS